MKLIHSDSILHRNNKAARAAKPLFEGLAVSAVIGALNATACGSGIGVSPQENKVIINIEKENDRETRRSERQTSLIAERKARLRCRLTQGEREKEGELIEGLQFNEATKSIVSTYIPNNGDYLGAHASAAYGTERIWLPEGRFTFKYLNTQTNQYAIIPGCKNVSAEECDRTSYCKISGIVKNGKETPLPGTFMIDINVQFLPRVGQQVSGEREGAIKVYCTTQPDIACRYF